MFQVKREHYKIPGDRRLQTEMGRSAAHMNILGKEMSREGARSVKVPHAVSGSLVQPSFTFSLLIDMGL